MVISAILAGLAAVGSFFFGGLKAAGSVAREMASVFYNYVYTPTKEITFKFFDYSPTSVKIIVFILLLVLIGNITVPFMLSFAFICDLNQTYKANNPGSAVSYSMAKAYNEFNSSIFPDVELNITTFGILYNQSLAEFDTGLNIRCSNNSPRVRFYTQDIFSFKMWVLLILIGVVLSIKSYWRKK